MELRNNNATLVALLGHLEGNERSEALIREVLDYAARVRTGLTDLRGSFERIDYPFDHAEGKMSVGQYLVEMVPPSGEAGLIFEATDQALNKLLEVCARAVSRLCVIAEAVEARQGYEPLQATEAIGL
jgi:hypothetical protein